MMAFIQKVKHSKLHLPFQLFTVGYVLLIFLPKVVRQGVFADGLTYSSIARNIAIGKGSFWQPYFSSTFWLPYNSGLVFYEHPPLMMGIQSLFFKIMGDQWYVEKVFSALVLAITLYLIVKLWTLVYKHNEVAKPYCWLVVLLFFTMPTIIWSYPNNLLDNTMAVFCLAAVVFSVKALHLNQRPVLNIALSSFFVLLAFLTKGPVGLFPLAIPFLYVLVYRHFTFRSFFLIQGLSILTFALFISLLLLYAPAREFLSNYLDQQVMGAVMGRREEATSSWLPHLDIIASLSLQLLPPTAIALLIVIGLKLRKTTFIVEQQTSKVAFFFLLIGLSASLPIAISPKQSSFYLIPSLPYFAMALVSVSLPTLMSTFNAIRLSRSATSSLNIVLAVAITCVLVYVVSITGSLRREKEFLRDLDKIARIVPKGTKLNASDNAIQDITTQAYFQRFLRAELSTDSTLNYFLVDSYTIDSLLIGPYSDSYRMLPLSTERFLLFENRPLPAERKSRDGKR